MVGDRGSGGDAVKYRPSSVRARLIAGVAVVGINVLVGGIAASSASATAPVFSVSRYAGTGSAGTTVSGPALSAAIRNPNGIDIDAAGNLYLADIGNNVVDKISPTGSLTIIAGTGTAGAITPGPATSSALNGPKDLALDQSGNVYVVDANSSSVEKISAGGILSRFAGNGSMGTPSPGPATSTSFGFVQGVAIDSTGNVYIADGLNQKIYKVTSGGTVSAFAGNGSTGSAIAGPATSSPIDNPNGMGVDSSGNLYVALADANQVVKITPSGTLSVVAGSGTFGTPTNGSATASTLSYPVSVKADAAGNLYITDQFSKSVVFVSGGQLTIIAGTPGSVGAVTPGPALSTTIGAPYGIAINATTGTVYFSDITNRGVFALNPPPASPNAPTGLTATPGDQSAALSFTAPYNGGSAITSYQYSSDGGSTWVTFTTSGTTTITGTATLLTNGTTYGIKVRAVNAIAPGAASAVASVTPFGPPGSVGSLTAAPGNASTTLSFTPPSVTNGSAITGYQYSVDAGATWSALTATGTSTLTATITGLTNGTAYTVKVRAVNAGGNGSVATVSVTPVIPAPSTPGAPTAVVGSAGTSSVTVSWSAPSPSTGVTGYTAYAHPGTASCTTASASDTSCVIGGTVGSSYTYTVVAHSAAGDSAASPASTPVTPVAPVVPSTAPLSAPTTLTTTNGQITQADPGQTVTIVGTGFAPYSTVSIIAFSTPQALANVTADANGNFSKTVTVPSDLAVGSHNLVATGVDPSGAAHTIRLAFAVTTSGLATTGIDEWSAIAVAVLLLLAGAGALVVARGRFVA